MPPLTGEPLDSLTARLRAQGEPAFRVKPILDRLYKKRVRSWDEMTNRSKPLRAWLAISLHGATDEVHEQIMPVNKAYPLAKLIPAVRTFAEKHGRMITLEFILVEDVNDSLVQTQKLRDIARDLQPM